MYSTYCMYVEEKDDATTFHVETCTMNELRAASSARLSVISCHVRIFRLGLHNPLVTLVPDTNVEFSLRLP